MFLALLTALSAAAAHAEDAGAGLFSFSGFGTLGVVHSSEHQADFTSSNFQSSGAGYSHSWSSDIDSRVGAQLTAHFTARISAVVQAVAEQRYDNSYRPRIEWANIKYLITPDFDVRIGRIEVPTFLVSDFRKVGYANPWVRTPVEVYAASPISSNVGIDFSYRTYLGDVTNTLQALYGNKNTYRFVGGVTGIVRDGWGIFDSAQYGAALLHFGYEQGRATLAPVIALFDAFKQFGPQGVAIGDRYELENKRASTVAVGASYDPGSWFAMAEWSRSDTHSFTGVRTGWYVSGGYRVGDFTPFFTRAQVTSRPTSDPGLTVSALPSAASGTAAALNAALNETLGINPIQNTVSLGARWDFMKNVDLKLQIDHTRVGAGSPGTLINIQPGFASGGTFNLFSAAVDFVF
jgi:hypothetical protein